MGNFEWRTEEDGAAEALEPTWKARSVPGRRLVLVILFVIFAAGGGAYWAYRASQHHVAEATARVEGDVRASHELVRRAGVEADLELFQRFISSADPDWAWAEEQMVSSGRWLDRSTLDLTWQQTLSSTAAITLSADMLEAEVISHEAYRYTDASGEEVAATLAQTHVYRLGPDRWLLAPPRPEFWGEEAVVQAPRLRLTYAARDGALAQRLAADLSELIERACRDLQDLDCPVDYRLATRFTRDPALLHNGQPGTLPLWAQRPLALPAPSLIGRPLGETGYRALYLGYGRQVIAAALGDLVGWRCCQPGLFFQALLEEQWQELGLAPAPESPPATVYRQMLQAQIDVGNASALWTQAPVVGDSASLQSARVIISFLRQRFPQTSITYWQRQLSAVEDYPQWLAATGDAGGPALAMGWHSYLYVNGGADASGSQREAPGEDLLLMCELEAGGRTVMRFDPQTETFARVLDGPPLQAADVPATMALAPPDGAFFADYPDGALRIWLWQNEQQRLLWESGQEESHYRFLGASPEGHSLLVQETDPGRRLPVYHVAAVSACLENGCNWRRSVYRPTWSPDGQHVINAVPQGNVLYLSETFSTLQPFWYMDVGTAPTWLDEKTFAYVKHRGGELTSLAIASVGERQLQTLVDIADLRGQLPPGAILAPTVGLVRHPADEKVLFLAVHTVRSQPPTATYVFLVRRDTHQVFNLITVDDGDPASLSISPIGRWLALESEEGLVLYDLVADRGGVYTDGPQAIAPLWSPSGEWLFTGGESLYYLIAPGGETRELRSDAPACDAALWIESE